MSHTKVPGKHRVHTSSVPAEGRLQCSDGGRSAHANVDRQAENTMTAHVKKKVQQKVALRCFAPPTALICRLEKQDAHVLARTVRCRWILSDTQQTSIELMKTQVC